MEVSINKQGGLDAVLSVKIAEADYREDLDKTVKEYGKKMRVPGFRPGKVPAGIIRKMVGNDAKREVVERFLQKNIQEYIDQNNIKLVLSPLSTYVAEDINWVNNDFEFSYDIGLRPEIKLPMGELNKLSRYDVQVDDKEVQEEVERMRKQAGRVQPQDKVTNDPELSISIHFHELDDEGQELEGGAHKVKTYKYDELPRPLAQLVDGQEKGFKTTAKITDIFTQDELAETFGLEPLAVKDLNPDFEVEVTNIFKIDLPEMNQDFFDMYFEPGKVTDEQGFNTEWRGLIENYYKQQADNVLAREIKDYLVDHTEMEMPQEFINKYMLTAYEAKSADDIEDYDTKKKAFYDELKWLMISEFVAEEQKIEITEEDVIDYTKEMVRQEFMRAGIPNIEDDQLRQYAINYLTKENNFNRTSLALRDGKVFEYLLSQVTPKSEQVTSKKFEEIRNKR
jgi:trigger factor